MNKIAQLCILLGVLIYAPASFAEFKKVDLNGGAISIGQGYDELLDQPRGHCVVLSKDAETLMKNSVFGTVAPHEAGSNGEGGDNNGQVKSETVLPIPQQVSYQLRILDIEEYRREFESLSVSASGSYGGFSGSASFSSEREFERTKNNLFIVLTVEVSNKVVSGDYFSPKPEFKSGDLFNLSERRCGTSFVTAIGFGGRMDLVARVNTLSESERTSMRASIGGGGSYGAASVKASASFTKMVETALDRRDVHLSIISSGPWFSDEAFKLSLEGGSFDISAVENINKLVNAAMLFPKAVNKRPWPYVGYLSDYETIGFNRQNVIAIKERRRILTDLLSTMVRYDLLLGQIRAVEENPDIFELIAGVDVIPAASKINEIRSEGILLRKSRDVIGQAAAKCYSEIDIGAGECIDISGVLVDGTPVDSTPFLTVGKLRLVSAIDESELCSEESAFTFPQLVPASGGCIDPNTSYVWSNPHFSVEADLAKYVCEKKTNSSSRTWNVPSEIDLRFFISGAYASRAKAAANFNATKRLFSDVENAEFNGEVGIPAQDSWVWSSDENGENKRVVNIKDRTSKDAGSTELHTVVCVSRPSQ